MKYQKGRNKIEISIKVIVHKGGVANKITLIRIPTFSSIFSVGCFTFLSQAPLHQYGQAYDFEQPGGTSLEYLNIWKSAKAAGAIGAYLLGTDGFEYWEPKYPSSVTYNRGHAQW